MDEIIDKIKELMAETGENLAKEKYQISDVPKKPSEEDVIEFQKGYLLGSYNTLTELITFISNLNKEEDVD